MEQNGIVSRKCRSNSIFLRQLLNHVGCCCDYQGMKKMPSSGRSIERTLEGQLFDEYLVTLIRSGDSSARERLAKRWQPRLLRTARRLLQNDEQAALAVQECWVSIMRGLAGLRDPSRFAPWAFGILRRRCIDAIRKASGARSVMVAGQEAQASIPAAQDEALAIREAFAALPADQRLAAQLYFVEGLTLAEIAEAQDVPLGTAKSRLFHARRQLKAALSEQGEEL